MSNSLNNESMTTASETTAVNAATSRAASIKSSSSIKKEAIVNDDLASIKEPAPGKDSGSIKDASSTKDATANESSSTSASPKPSADLEKSDGVTTTGNKNIFRAEVWKEYKTPILLCLVTSLSGLIFGWDVGTIGGMTNMESFKRHFGQMNSTGDYSINHWIVGLIISIFNIFCAIGGLSLAKLADRFGRKTCIYASLMVYHVGILIQWTSVFSGAWYHFMIGRMVTGLAVGSTSVVCPMFLSESAPIEIRGSMVVFYQFMITFGILLGGIVNYACKTHQGSTNASWIIPVCLSHLFAGLIMAFLWMMPESAVYYVSRGLNEEAAQSVAKMNKQEDTDALVVDEVEKLVTNHTEVSNATADASFLDVFKGSNLPRLVIGTCIMLFQQLTGCNYFFYYGTSLFSRVGLRDSYVTAIVLGAVNFGSTFIGIPLVDRIGRKFCFYLGSVVMFVSMIIYASVGSFKIDGKGSGGVMIAFTCIYIAGFATTWGPVAFVSVSELYSVKTKATSMGIATSANWMMNFLISLFTPSITASIDYKFGYVFAGCLFVSFFFVMIFVPETKGKRIEDIEAIYNKKASTTSVDEN